MVDGEGETNGSLEYIQQIELFFFSIEYSKRTCEGVFVVQNRNSFVMLNHHSDHVEKDIDWEYSNSHDVFDDNMEYIVQTNFSFSNL